MGKGRGEEKRERERFVTWDRGPENEPMLSASVTIPKYFALMAVRRIAQKQHLFLTSLYPALFLFPSVSTTPRRKGQAMATLLNKF